MEGSRCSFPALSKLTPEDQTQHESNSERREYCFCWIFTDVLLGVFLERCERGSWHRPTLVLLCRVHRPRLAPLFRGILRRKHLRLISNLPLLYEHVLCCSAIYSAHRRWPMMSVVLVYFLLPLVISSWFVRCDYPRALLNGQTPTCLKS